MTVVADGAFNRTFRYTLPPANFFLKLPVPVMLHALIYIAKPDFYFENSE